MSLINDALKKAQHQRKDDPAATTGGAGEARIHRRGRAQSANTMVLLGSAAVVLVVLSVVFTFFLVNQPAKPAAPVAKAAPNPAPTPSAPATTPTPVEATPPAPAPTPAVPAVSVPLATAPAGQGSTPPPPLVPAVATATGPAVTPTAPIASSPGPTSASPAASAPASNTAAPDERVASFVEAVRVTGIRSFGNESRVLMNERVFRVNDIVDRLLGVKLTAVKADSLTFTDANGVTYVKNF